MDDFVRIPDYIDTYDDIMYVEYPTGDAEIVVGKKIDGYAVIIELVAGKRQALMFKQMRGMSDAKYKGMYKKRDPAYSGGVQAQTANATTSKPGKNLSAAKITPEREKVNADSANANREAVKQADNHPNRSSDALNRATDVAPPPSRSAALEALKTLGDTPAGRRAKTAADAAAQAFRYIREAAQRSDEAAYATALGVLRHSAKELSDLAVSGALPEDAARAADHVAAKAKDLPGKATDLPASADDQKRTVAPEAQTQYNPSKEAIPKEGASDGDLKGKRGENDQGNAGAQTKNGDRPDLQGREREAQANAGQEAALDRTRGRSVAAEAREAIAEYGAETVIVKDSEWNRNEPAYTKNGKVYLRETIPEEYRGMIAPHEVTHLMRQSGYEPYLAFIKRTPDMMNIPSDGFARLMDYFSTKRGVDLFDLDGLSEKEQTHAIEIAYDELISTLYGHLAASKYDRELIAGLQGAFKDMDVFFGELNSIHEQFKRSRDGGKTPGSD